MKPSLKEYKLQKAAALRYDRTKNVAPVIIASGQGELAEKIIELAMENKIHVQKNLPLVDALVKLEIGQEIPADLYEAVAVVLAYIMEADEVLSS